MEIYKDIIGYEGLYQVSNLGNVKSLHFNKEKVLKKNAGSNGYINSCLRKNGVMKNFSNHQLVCVAFLNHVPNGYKGLVCDHKNNNKLDNRLDNLQVITKRYNSSKDKKNKTSKYTGVYWVSSRNKWKAGIKIKGKYNFLGYFINELDASNKYQEALKKHLNDSL